MGGRLGNRSHPMAVGETPPLGKKTCAVSWRGSRRVLDPCEGAGIGIASCWMRTRLKPWVIGACVGSLQNKGSLDLSLLLPLGLPGMAWAYLQLGLGLGSFVCSPLELLHLGKDPNTARAPTSDVPHAWSSLGRLTQTSLDFILSSTSATSRCFWHLAVHVFDLYSVSETIDNCHLRICTEMTMLDWSVRLKQRNSPATAGITRQSQFESIA